MADDPTPEPDATPEPEPTPDDKPLGPSGEKALGEWKARAKAAEAEAKRAVELEARLAEIEQANMSEQEKAIELARKESAEAARTEVLGTVNRRLFAAELKAAATGKVSDVDLLSDPDVAIRLLGFDDYPVNEAGDIDAEAISAAVGQLIEAKPYLAASATPVPGIDQGARGTARTVETLDEAIAKAEADGDAKRSLALKTQKLAALPRP